MIRDTVQKKLQASGTSGLLTRMEHKPTDSNLHSLQAELVHQMEEDQAFAEHLQALIILAQEQSPSLQVVLEDARVSGSVDLGNVQQISEATSAEQIVGQNLDVEGNLTLGDITQWSRGKQ